MRHSLPSVLGAPLCCFHLLLLINAHILNIFLSAHSQSGVPALHTANNPTGTERLLGWKEFGQREDVSPSEERWERREGNRLEKPMTETLSVSCGSPGAIRMNTGLWGIYAEGERVWSVAMLRAERRWSWKCFALPWKTSWTLNVLSLVGWQPSIMNKPQGTRMHGNLPPALKASSGTDRI